MTTSPAADPVPSVWTALTSPDPQRLLDFLVAGLGLTSRAVYGDGEHVAHAEATWVGPTGQVGGVMIAPPGPDCTRSPGAASVHLVCADPDGLLARAVAAGGVVTLPLQDADYGSRLAAITDPDGNVWSFGTWYE